MVERSKFSVVGETFRNIYEEFKIAKRVVKTSIGQQCLRKNDGVVVASDEDKKAWKSSS